LEQGTRPALFFRHAFGSRNDRLTQRIATQRMTAPDNPIQLSFVLAAERCADLTPLVYDRLFRQHAEIQSMFRSEGGELVRGSMLALTVDAMLDFAGDRSGHFRMIECEEQSHDDYGTPRELFGKFFGVIAATVRELLANDWSPEIDAAWRKLLDEIDSLVASSQAQIGPDIHGPRPSKCEQL
jgi:hemoglobin-like flavoprotein